MHAVLSGIRSIQLQAKFKEITELLPPSCDLVFSLMKDLTRGERHPFEFDSGLSDQKTKYKEIEARLFDTGRVFNGPERALNLMASIYESIETSAVIVREPANLVLDRLVFPFDDNSNLKVKLTPSLCWATVWTVTAKSSTGSEEIVDVPLRVHRKDWGNIVPEHVVEIIDSAIFSYKRRMYTATLALATIALEATLREVLGHLGYVHKPRSTPGDIYQWIQAQLTCDEPGGYYRLSVTGSAKPLSDFDNGSAGPRVVDVKIKRVVERSNPCNSFTLKVKVQSDSVTSDDAVDYLTSDTIEQPGDKVINSLSDALYVARCRENILTPHDLFLGFDEVAHAIRNNLVHLSGQSMKTPLEGMADAYGIESFTIQEFINRPELVFDFLRAIALLVDKQYFKLRELQNI